MTMRSPLCNECNMATAICHCMTHSAVYCRLCDWKLHLSDVTMDTHDQSRFLLCIICVSEIAVVLDQGLCLCQTCVGNANVVSRFLLCNGSNNNNSLSYSSPLDLDLDSSCSSCSSSLFDPKKLLSFNNLDSSSSAFGFFHYFDNSYTKNYSDQPVPMPQTHFLDIPKEGSYSGFNNAHDIKEDIYNVWMNTFDGDLKDYFPGDDLIQTDQVNIDEITKHNPQTITEILSSPPTCVSSVTHKDYSIEALANPSYQDYNKNQMLVGSKSKEETYNTSFGIFPKGLAQLDCGRPPLNLADEMIPWDDQTLASNRPYSPRSRGEAVKRYFAKKKKRKFGKQIRYHSRKSTADTKRRWKGRFTKAGAEYDYDPVGANNENEETSKSMSE